MNLEKMGFYKNLFFHYFKWNWGGLGVSRVTARTIRRHRHKFSRDLVLHGIRKSTFRKYWNFNVLEMALKTFLLSRVFPGHLYYLFSDISPTYFFENISNKHKNWKLKIWKSENPKIWLWNSYLFFSPPPPHPHPHSDSHPLSELIISN